MARAIRRTLLGLVALAPVLIWRGTAEPTNLPKYAVVVSAAAVLAVVVARPHWGASASRLPRPFAVALVCFLLAAALAAATSPMVRFSMIGEYNHYSGLVAYAAYVVIAIATFRSFDLRSLSQLMKAAALGLALVVAYGLIQMAGVDPLDWETYGFGGVSSTLGNSNVLALFTGALVALPLSLSLDMGERAAMRIAAAGLVVASLVVLVGAASIQGFLAAGVGLAFVGASHLTASGHHLGGLAHRRWILVAAGGCGVLGLLALVVRASATGLFAVLGERAYLYEAAANMLRAHPLFGVGLDGFALAFPRYRPAAHAEAFGSTIADAAHSVPLNMFAVGGVLLGLAYLAVVVVVGRAVLQTYVSGDGRQRALGTALGAAWLAYQAGSLVGFERPATAFVHWWLVGAIMAIAQGSRETKHQRVPKWVGKAAPAAIGLAAVVAMAAYVVVPVRADRAVVAGVDAAEAGDAALAREKLEQATDLAPYRSQYWVFRADLLQRLGAPGEAADVAAQGAAAVPTDVVLATFAAGLYEAVGVPEKAALWAEEARSRETVPRTTQTDQE